MEVLDDPSVKALILHKATHKFLSTFPIPPAVAAEASDEVRGK
jgi:hypothetical protein